MSKGSRITWLSVYPKEKETLYPPLTYLTLRSSQGSCAWKERIADDRYFSELTDANKNEGGRIFTVVEIAPSCS